MSSLGRREEITLAATRITITLHPWINCQITMIQISSAKKFDWWTKSWTTKVKTTSARGLWCTISILTTNGIQTSKSSGRSTTWYRSTSSPTTKTMWQPLIKRLKTRTRRGFGGATRKVMEWTILLKSISRFHFLMIRWNHHQSWNDNHRSLNKRLLRLEKELSSIRLRMSISQTSSNKSLSNAMRSLLSTKGP